VELFFEIAGWVGAAAILAGYFLFSIGKIQNGFRYQWLNLAGSAALLTNALANQSWPFVILNAVWSVTAIFALIQLWRKARKDADPAAAAI
jgi:hypothetical protein